MAAPSSRHAYLKQKIYESDDTACFITRERILQKLDLQYRTYYAYDREARILADLLDQIDTPVDPQDVIVGRMTEAVPDPDMHQASRIRYRFGEEACLRDYPNDTSVTFPSPLLYSYGHMTYDWKTLLEKGYRGILEQIERAAVEKGDPESLLYRENARLIIGAIRRFAQRYARAAERAGNHDAAQALSCVPFEPAYDLYSALSAVWLVHMIASCMEGARDFGFGRMDQYLLPYYEQSVKSGRMSREDAVELLSYFLLKPNEICGRTVYNGTRKPIPCHTSKQYLLLGGDRPNDLSVDLLRAAARNNMAQPVVTVLWKQAQPADFRREVFETMNRISDKMHVYNYDLVTQALKNRGVPPEYIAQLTYTGCCSMEFSSHTTRNEYYINTPKVLCQLLGLLDGETETFSSLEDLYARFTELCRLCMQDYIDYIVRLYGKVYTRRHGVLDALHVCACNRNCRYPGEGGAEPVRLYNVFLAGLATTADSFHVIDELVFRQKRLTMQQLHDMLAADYAGYEALLAEIRAMTFFGNDDDAADAYAVRTANALMDACQAVELPDKTYLIGSFYSLDRSYTYGLDLPATPNGRHYGEYISENQSPSYGAAHNGATAELSSLSKLPFIRSGGGGYNLTLSRRLDTPTLQALLESYFEMGGQHVGMTYINRETLEDAMIHPESYQDLTVRLYGYSEYFVKMDRWQQIEYLKRTAY